MALRSVLVTGSSRGLGLDMTRHLAGNGFRVLAGVRTAADGERLVAEIGAAVTPVVLDVADAGSIAAAATQVARLVGDAGLAGLVNNAGIASFGPLEQEPMARFEQIFRVNVFGVQALTQALLPLVRRARGRIVNISSGNGKLAFPFCGPYSASKFALEAMSDSLRMELAPWGIHVVVVEPGAMATDIRVKGIEAWAAEHGVMPEADRALYAEQLEAVRGAIHAWEATAAPSDLVSAAVLEALTAPEPKTRYVVGLPEEQLQVLVSLPDRERDKVAAGMFGLEVS
jgi:NAD(P)-dependent dehydrogenase (short-subunit alcohol dehydrogenase family)